MLFYKWCPFLTRTMSPLVVGLIWCCLIGVSSLSHPSRTSFLHPTARAVFNLNKNTSHFPYAKQNIHHRTKPSTLQSTSDVVSRSSRPMINDGSKKDIETRSKRILPYYLNSRLKVKNINEENSTIVYLPRLSRSMANFSTNSDHDLQPIIVSKNRRILLDPKEFKVKRTSSSNYSPKPNASSQFGLRTKNKFSQNSAHPQTRKLLQKPSEKYKRTTATPNIYRRSKPVNLSSHLLSESTVLVNSKSNKNNTNSKNSILLFSPTNRTRNEDDKIVPRLNRRRGRTFDTSDTREEKETNSGELVSISAYNDTTDSIYPTRKRNKLLANSRLFSSFRNPSSQEDLQYSIEKDEEKQFSDLGHSFVEKKAKNLTIYEILKPKLKTNASSDELVDFSPGQNSLALQNDVVYHQIQDIEEKESNSSIINAIKSKNTNNNTLVINEIQDGVSNYENSMVVVPSSSDSNYGAEYITTNRTIFATLPPLNKNKNSSLVIVKYENQNYHPVKAYLERVNNTNINLREFNRPEKHTTEITLLEKDILFHQSKENDGQHSYLIENSNVTMLTSSRNSSENLSADGSESVPLLFDSEQIRQPKMTEDVHNGNTPYKSPKIDSKVFYDYFSKRPVGNVTLREFPYPEYRPGNMFRYSDIYQRKPILEVPYTRQSTTLVTVKTEPEVVTEEVELIPTTFNSLRTSVRVLSTYYPNRMQDVTMKFGNRVEATTLPNSSSSDKRPEYRSEDIFDESEYRDSLDPGFTMEKLAYLLIGTCCGLSILCLVVVVIAIKCRRAIVEKRLKAQFRKRMYQHERMKDMTSPWQQQVFDHFMYMNRRPGDSSACSSNADSCNCRCVTWSLGARNLDSTRPLCPTSRSSTYLYGQKKLPFGAASTLQFESMLGRKRQSTQNAQQKRESPNTDSSHENDSLDLDSDSREGDGPKQCTCIDYNLWPMQPVNVPRGFYTLCPNPGRYNLGKCSQHHPVDLRTLAKDLPPPVTGSNYLDRSEGVVYWSSNDERLI